MNTYWINSTAMKPQARKRRAINPPAFKSLTNKPQTYKFHSSVVQQELTAEVARCCIKDHDRQISILPISPPDSQWDSDLESPVLSRDVSYDHESDLQGQAHPMNRRTANAGEDEDLYSASDISHNSSDDYQNEAFDHADEEDEENYEKPDMVEQCRQTLEEGYRLNREIINYEDGLAAKNERIQELENRVRELISVDKDYPRSVFFGSRNNVKKYCKAIKKLDNEKKILEEKYERIRDEFDAYLANASEDQDNYFKIIEESSKQKDLMVDFYREECRRNKEIAEKYKSQLMKVKKEKPVLKKNGSISARR